MLVYVILIAKMDVLDAMFIVDHIVVLVARVLVNLAAGKNARGYVLTTVEPFVILDVIPNVSLVVVIPVVKLVLLTVEQGVRCSVK